MSNDERDRTYRRQRGRDHRSVAVKPRLDYSKLVYLYLEIATEATIDEIQNALGVKKITLYSLLRTLMSAGLVRRSGTTYMLHERMSEGGTE